MIIVLVEPDDFYVSLHNIYDVNRDLIDRGPCAI